MTAAMRSVQSIMWQWGRLGMVLLALLAIMLAGCASDHSRETPVYDPETVVYDQPLHGEYETDTSRTSIAYVPGGGPRPAMHVPDDYVDLGRLGLGEVATHTFVVSNMGSATLTITRLYTTCTFMEADLTASVIPPGRVALLTVTLDLSEHSDSTLGMVRRGVILESNDSQQPETTLWVRADITP